MRLPLPSPTAIYPAGAAEAIAHHDPFHAVGAAVIKATPHPTLNVPSVTCVLRCLRRRIWVKRGLNLPPESLWFRILNVETQVRPATGG